MANRIRELRKEQHMSQIHLSIELEVSQETISAYEKGKHYPSYQSLVKMSKIFNASIDYIMGLSNQKNSISDIANDECDLLRHYRLLNSSNKERVNSYMQGLYDSEKL